MRPIWWCDIDTIIFYIKEELYISCDLAALWMVHSVCLSARPPVPPPVCLSFSCYVSIIVSTWNFQGLLPLTEVMSIQKVKVKRQGYRGQN